VRGLPLLIISALASSAGVARAQAAAPVPAEAEPVPSGPSGASLSATLGAGGETGLSTGRSGLLELELTGGWEHRATRLRPELGLVLGVAPENSMAIRAGLRAGLAEVPIGLRAAIDVSNARHRGLHARWILLGGAWELRVTTLLSFTVGLDFGVPLSGSAGVPILFRGGGTFSL
jgi:hypothetical protein